MKSLKKYEFGRIYEFLLLFYFFLTYLTVCAIIVLVFIHEESEIDYRIEQSYENCLVIDKIDYNKDDGKCYLTIIEVDNKIFTLEGKEYCDKLECQKTYKASILKIYKGKRKLVNTKILSISY